MGFFSSLLDPVFRPLLNLGPFWAILIISVVISVVFTLVQKFATDQKKMKELKLEMKANQKKMKELKNEPEKLMAMQKESMKKNMEYMKLSFRATLITIIPILIVFSWMQGSLAFAPILPGSEFSISHIFDEDFKGEVEVKLPEGIELLGSQPLFELKNSFFGSDKSVRISFAIDEVDEVEKVFLKSEVGSSSGGMIVRLNGEEIYNDKAEKELAVKLPQGLLKNDNYLIFESASPGWAFWRTNKAGLEGIKVIADWGEEAKELELEAEKDGEKYQFEALKEGEYFIDFKYDNGEIFSKEVVITNKFKYAEPVEAKKGFGTVQISYLKLRPLGNFNIWGWYPGWLALYISFSLVLGLGLRKLLGLY